MRCPALVVDTISAGYVRGMPIIHDVSIAANNEEIVCIVGPNGAGKSTLLKSIAGLLRVESGSISLGGSSITGIRPDTLSQSGIAFVPQLNNIFRTMSVEQNLALAARRCKGKRKHRVQAMTSLFPVLSHKYKAKAGSLSGGQRQLLAIAMALIAEPELLLLDEPSAGLSPKAAFEVLGMLQGIADTGVAVLMVEQNVKAALRVSDRAYVLAEGRNQHEGEAKTLLNDPVLGEIYLGVRRRESHAAKSV
ncbi:MAG: ABC transporter ATP-binding protein [Granulosicoccus sp.]